MDLSLQVTGPWGGPLDAHYSLFPAWASRAPAFRERLPPVQPEVVLYIIIHNTQPPENAWIAASLQIKYL